MKEQLMKLANEAWFKALAKFEQRNILTFLSNNLEHCDSMVPSKRGEVDVYTFHGNQVIEVCTSVMIPEMRPAWWVRVV